MKSYPWTTDAFITFGDRNTHVLQQGDGGRSTWVDGFLAEDHPTDSWADQFAAERVPENWAAEFGAAAEANGLGGEQEYVFAKNNPFLQVRPCPHMICMRSFTFHVCLGLTQAKNSQVCNEFKFKLSELEAIECQLLMDYQTTDCMASGGTQFIQSQLCRQTSMKARSTND